MHSSVVVRPAAGADLPAVAAIYDAEIATGTATFYTTPRPLESWQERLAGREPGDHFLVAADAGGVVLGYAYSCTYRPHPAYAGTRETSVYLDASAQGRGIGTLLYRTLLDAMAASGVHTAVAVVALPNPGSVALHEAVGFELAGTLREVGHKFGRYIDTAYYQRMLRPSGSVQPGSAPRGSASA